MKHKISFCFVCLLCVLLTGCSGADLVSYCVADADGEAGEELLVIAGGKGGQVLPTGEAYGSHLEIYKDFSMEEDVPRPRGKPWRRFDFTDLCPSKVQCGDVQGDGTMDIAITVYKKTRFHPVEAKRPFFYYLNNGNLVPLWRGSRLSRPFRDFVLADLDQDGADEILSLEETLEGKGILALYDWAGFGFDLAAQSREVDPETVFVQKYRLEEPVAYCQSRGQYQAVFLQQGILEIRNVKEE